MRLERLLKFSVIIGKLKDVKRTGWTSHVGIEKPESVADHSFRCAVLAMCVGDLSNVDTEKLIRMLLLHDIQEALTGDYDSYAKKEMGISKVRSQQRIAIGNILSLLPAGLGKRYLLLWEEFENQTTPEAILARDIDKIEMVMQALKYEKEGYDKKKLQTFWNEVKDKIRFPMIQVLFELLINRRIANRQPHR